MLLCHVSWKSVEVCWGPHVPGTLLPSPRVPGTLLTTLTKVPGAGRALAEVDEPGVPDQSEESIKNTDQ